ncbi:hypothetical protein [Mucilaginibacter gossypiicola]|uniref:hypothetical protein n=1 Tax=Mucilaginibacter gossypiicola TaxID=551995 RepID=UPI00115FA74A|nr:hypothetical protein [Mucilaginibacter gossypiicola]
MNEQNFKIQLISIIRLIPVQKKIRNRKSDIRNQQWALPEARAHTHTPAGITQKVVIHYYA